MKTNWNRRDFLKTASAATLSALAAGYPRALVAAEAEEKIKPTADTLIVLWLAGGMAHTETFDPKRYSPFERGMKPADMFSTFPTIDTAVDPIKFTAGLVNSDPLMTALGRPNREQVITTRASAATTLQGLELTNGRTLAELLKRGAEEVVERWPKPARELIFELYQRALGRQPSGEELRLAQEMVGSPLKKEGVEDLLWAMTMLPEFQLIY